ncbi:uncharacterized protein LOC116182622, partial [Photinus pyralis]|uniref:uncharacterized protein LOC116182622 n=1 Tax=Photinus pyralis TaxID=7054 RepID=UPI0012671875
MPPLPLFAYRQQPATVSRAIYRPTKGSGTRFLAAIETSLADMSVESDQLFCLGDFNLNYLDYSNYLSMNLFSILRSLNLKQVVTEPTRITANSATLIDLVITDNDCDVLSTQVVDMHTLTDHLLVVCRINLMCSTPPALERTYRDFKHFYYQLFDRDLRAVNWNTIYNLPSIDDKVEFLTVNIIHLLDVHAPVKTSKFIKPFAPWLTDTLRIMMSLRNKALQRFKHSGCPSHWDYYKTLRNLTNTAVKAEKKAYLEFTFKTKSPKTVWHSLRKMNICGSSSNISIPPNLNDVNKINEYFVESVRSAYDNIDIINKYANNCYHKDSTRFCFTLVDEVIIAKILSKMSSKSSGCDDLRPITILPALSKVLEKVLEYQLRQFLSKHSILPLTQSGFRAGYSCATALCSIVDDIVTETDCGKITILVLLDYSKAFDMLSHQVLNAILKFIGLDYNALKLIRNYLSDRCRRVTLNGVNSELTTVSRGVPQGSILGPLLYTVYTFNLLTGLNHCKYHLYADDTQLYYSFTRTELESSLACINEDLENVHKASEEHSLIVNPAKSYFIVFGDDNIGIHNKIALKIGNDSIPSVKCVKNVGVLIDCKLRFTQHIDNLIASAYGQLRSLYSSRHILGTKHKAVLCDSLVLSRFNYCDVLYGPCLLAKDRDRIQRVQNSCLRFVFGIRKYDRISHTLPRL